MSVHVTTAGNTLSVSTPHPNTNFNKKARDLAGRWQPELRAWTFDARNEALVRAALKRSYGTDGTAPADVVSVQMTVDKSEWHGPVVVAGRVICRASGRDSGATLGTGVVKLSGRATSGGSRINWTSVADGSFVLHDVPRKVADKLIAGGYAGVTEAKEFDPATLVDADDDD
ncbi:hypothetical protein OKC48_07465 [Methylorubrum extorquens]|uniref:hypothetical protein n=1 Tax=Methylorubrum extorquens TaxID=408 RepID=UPI0022389BF5|nr:hypothetical protein [Methylorubrum extorquens]UYW28344.1 hypothetical protein OKC48_07465 [Methylorubrum extorquens]